MPVFNREIVEEVNVDRMICDIGVRYWEDFTLNKKELTNNDGEKVPGYLHDRWLITIDLNEGRILNWPEGNVLSCYAKVCDDGTYRLLTPHGKIVAEKSDYVPDMIGDCGDYVALDIDENGFIKNFRVDLSYFEEI